MWMEVLIAEELDIRLTVQIAKISGGWSAGFHDEYAAALWGGNAYVGCSSRSRSVSAGAVGLIERGRKRSADGD